MFLILAVVIIVLAIENHSYKKEHKELNKKILEQEQKIRALNSNILNMTNNPRNNNMPNVSQNQQYNNMPNMTRGPQYNNMPNMSQNQQYNNMPNMTRGPQYNNMPNMSQNQQYNNMQNMNVQKITKSDEGIKNKFILMTGAILIVLAAIVFLTSTWNVIPNILKTTIIVLLAGVFIGASNIAKKVFKLEETANTFFYIALAYLPIALFSISLFGLIGDYLSIKGAGKYIYFAVSSIFLATLYFIIGETRNKKEIFHSSMIMQILSVIFTANIFSKQISTIFLWIEIYGIILKIIEDNKYLKKYSNTIKLYSNVYLYTIFICEIVLMTYNYSIINIIANLLLILGFYINYKKYKNISSISIALICVLTSSVATLGFFSNVMTIAIQQMILFSIIIIMYLFGMVNNKSIVKETAIYISTISMLVFWLWTVLFFDKGVIIKSDIILWTVTILNIISYIVLQKRRKLFINIIPISVFFAMLNTINVNHLNYSLIIITSLIGLILSLFNKDSGLQITSNIILIISMLISYISGELIYNIVITICIVALSTVLSIKDNNENTYKIFSGIYVSMMMLLNFNIYVRLIIALSWSLIHTFAAKNQKAVFQTISCILGLILYNNAIWDISKYNGFISSITLIKLLGYMVCTLAITRGILKTSVPTAYKIIEYIAFSIIYKAAIEMYSSQMDSMIFIFMLVILILISYMLKWGPVFFISTIAIIVNIFNLTKEFWYSIPWWVYMLLIGSTLIIFAIKNELNETKQKESIRSKLKTIKDNIDM